MPSDQIDYTKNSKMVYEFEIEVEYIHHLKEFYKRIHRWLDQEDFIDINGNKKYEQLYWQRDLPNGKQEHHLWWRAWKHPGYEIHKTTQFKWFIQMTARTIDTSKTDMMHKGKKWRMYMANPTFNFKAYLIYDYSTGFEKNPFLKTIAERWKWWIYKDRMKRFEDELIYLMTDLNNVCKAFLQLKQSYETPPNIYPPNAAP